MSSSSCAWYVRLSFDWCHLATPIPFILISMEKLPTALSGMFYFNVDSWLVWILNWNPFQNAGEVVFCSKKCEVTRNTEHTLAHKLLESAPWMNRIHIDSFVGKLAGEAELAPSANRRSSMPSRGGEYRVELLVRDLVKRVLPVDDESYGV